MNWNQVINHPGLQDLPFKLELNEYAQIVMTPLSNLRSAFKSEIGIQLERCKTEGHAIINCSILTRKNVKVADVVWCSREFFAKNGYDTPYQESPEICVEIVSLSNSKRGMNEKKKLYFERGAREVWLCYENGKLEFYNQKKEIEQSTLFQNFPKQIEVTWK